MTDFFKSVFGLWKNLWADPYEQVRIAHVWGHGEWHSIESEAALIAWVNALNSEYGQGTHWIERR